MPDSLERTCVRVYDPLDVLPKRELAPHLVAWFNQHSRFGFWTDDEKIRLIKTRPGLFDDIPLCPDRARRIGNGDGRRVLANDEEDNLSFQGRLDERIKNFEPKMQEALRVHVRIDGVRPTETVRLTATRIGLSYGYLRKEICVVRRDLGA